MVMVLNIGNAPPKGVEATAGSAQSDRFAVRDERRSIEVELYGLAISGPPGPEIREPGRGLAAAHCGRRRRNPDCLAGDHHLDAAIALPATGVVVRPNRRRGPMPNPTAIPSANSSLLFTISPAGG
jgi:hypothetical protein